MHKTYCILIKHIQNVIHIHVSMFTYIYVVYFYLFDKEDSTSRYNLASNVHSNNIPVIPYMLFIWSFNKLDYNKSQICFGPNTIVIYLRICTDTHTHKQWTLTKIKEFCNQILISKERGTVNKTYVRISYCVHNARMQ